MNIRAPRCVVAIADPFPDEAELYELAFGTAGFALHTLPADDPARAADEVASRQPHLVVTRILPRRFGIELIRRVRGDERTAKIPIIVLTTFPDPALHAEARALGANELLLLPVDPDDLIQRARRLIDA
jgi:DNA-binding response OmpR family regulator